MMHRPGGGRHGTRAVRERQMTRHRSHRAGDQPPLAIANGATRIVLIEMITHLAFYTGGPIPVSAIKRVRELLPEIADLRAAVQKTPTARPAPSSAPSSRHR